MVEHLYCTAAVDVPSNDLSLFKKTLQYRKVDETISLNGIILACQLWLHYVLCCFSGYVTNFLFALQLQVSCKESYSHLLKMTRWIAAQA